jgi:hypothetical protein
MPCYGRLGSCTSFASAPVLIVSVCEGAAQAPYLGNATQMALALRALYANACYIRDGGVMTPPAYGTLGNAGRNAFKGPGYTNVDLNLAKRWHVGERYSAQLRIEVFNLFNHPNFGQPGGDPTVGGSATASGFGYTRAITGSARRMQFGLKLAF